MRQRDFQFLTINTQSLWQEQKETSENLDITAEGLSLHRSFGHALEHTFDLSSSTPADFAVDCGVLYILDSLRCNVQVYDTHSGSVEWLECFGGCGDAPGRFQTPQAMALSRSDLYIADTENHRVQVFARSNLQLRWIVGPSTDSEGEPLSGRMKPLALTLDADDNLYVIQECLDRFGGLEEPPRFVIQQFDSGGRLLGTFAEDGMKPTHLAVERHKLYVLDAAVKRVLKFDVRTQELGTSVELEVDSEASPSGLVAHSFNVGRAETLRLYVGDSRDKKTDKDRFLGQFDASGQGLGPVSGFIGKCQQLRRDVPGNLYVLDGDTHQIVQLKFAKRFLPAPGNTSPRGRYLSKVLDSGKRGLQWHKIVMEATIPDRTQVAVSYAISDTQELPADERWSVLPPNPRDALVLGSQGRYLRFKIELFGDEEHTPTVKRVSAYFPRLSYLRYLPAIYQEDAASRDFLERFLSLFETFLFNMEEQIFHVTRLLDVDATPFDTDSPERDFLKWLASWLGVAFDEDWSEAKKRELLSAVPQLYTQRGTREGLQQFIEIYVGKAPIIVEHFQLDCIENEDDRETWSRLFGDCRYCFCVLLLPQAIAKQSQLNTLSQLNTIRRIIESEKPAHTNAGVRVLQPWIYLDMHTYLEINTVLSEPVFRLDETSVVGQSVLGRDTVLPDPEAGGQIERHGRVGIDTRLT